MRTFIAIELSENLKNFLAELIKVKANLEGISVVKKENFHITLKFLGEVEDRIIPNLSKILISIANQFEPFSLKLTHPGVFPDKIRPKVIWIGTENNDTLKKLAKQIDERVHELGFQKENREYKSHITLARVKNYQNGRYLFQQILKNFSEYTSNLNFQNGSDQRLEIFVKDFVLMKSTLTPQGSIYEILERFPLCKINGIIKQNA